MGGSGGTHVAHSSMELAHYLKIVYQLYRKDGFTAASIKMEKKSASQNQPLEIQHSPGPDFQVISK
jgi:thioredoxin reductase